MAVLLGLWDLSSPDQGVEPRPPLGHQGTTHNQVFIRHKNIFHFCFQIKAIKRLKKKKNGLLFRSLAAQRDRAGTRGATVLRNKLEFIVHFTYVDSAA